jgi:hypothetical protein
VRLLQRLDQQEDFDGHIAVHVWCVGEGAVAAASDDGLEGVDEAAKACRLEGRKLLLEEGHGGGPVARPVSTNSSASESTSACSHCIISCGTPRCTPP